MLVISQSQGSVMALKTFDLYCTSIQESWAEMSSGVLTAEIIKTVFKIRDINKRSLTDSIERKKCMLF
jgi:hypothetical protein